MQNVIDAYQSRSERFFDCPKALALSKGAGVATERIRFSDIVGRGIDLVACNERALRNLQTKDWAMSGRHGEPPKLNVLATTVNHVHRVIGWARIFRIAYMVVKYTRRGPYAASVRHRRTREAGSAVARRLRAAQTSEAVYGVFVGGSAFDRIGISC